MTDTLTHDVEEPWGDELPRRERRRLVTPVTAALAAVAIAALGFLGGVQVQKSQGAGTGAAGAGGARPTGFPRGAGAAPGAGGAQAGDATVGEVSSVDGKTFYVDDASGNTIRVRLGKGAKVTRTAVSTVGAIHPGDTVIVQGETATSGTVVASTIRATASNAGGGLGGFGAAPGAPGGG